ncbi:hypothetical protein QYF36_004941 [Acer negundo]|nr:hypothetical protein QYF36_004941 [Acer negundo]
MCRGNVNARYVLHHSQKSIAMRKKAGVVVLSSDDEDDKPSLSSNRSYAKSKSKPLFTCTNPRPAKKPRLSGSRTRSHFCKESSNVNENGVSFEDFDDLLNGFKVSAGSGRIGTNELWVDKYKPCSVEELAVHKKKVEEIKTWFEKRLRTKDDSSNHVLVITGPAGVGKSATIHVIASHLGARLYEWNTPTPTIWQEHVHNCNSGVRYTSKLDEFENFIDRIRKYGLITPSFTGESRSSIILVIDDLPVTNGRTAFERLQNCLLLLVRSVRIPTAIVVTECEKVDSGDYTPRSFEELQSSLVNAGACKVAFNPITNNSIKKTLLRICRQEQCSLTAEQIDLLAKASGGDIRHAITSLQLVCMNFDRMLNLPSSNSSSNFSKEKADELSASGSGFSMQFGRDETLSLFHALGKFLHNKRETENVTGMDQDAFCVLGKFSRLPFKMDAPEMVLCQAHGQARPVADFLHENVLEFIGEEAMDDASAVASYLGDADLLFASFRGILTRYNEAENVLQSAAASVAVRGVLFGNSQPLPSRWHAIRRPKLWQVEQSAMRNKIELVKNRVAYNGSSLSDVSVIATELAPALKWLGYRSSRGLESRDVSMQGNETEDDSLASLDDEEYGKPSYKVKETIDSASRTAAEG